MKDIKADLATVVKTGKILTGSKEVVKALLTSNPKLTLISRNCPDDLKETVVYYSQISKIPCHVVEETSKEFGSVCGKPFPVSVLAVMDEGDSNILSKLEKKD